MKNKEESILENHNYPIGLARQAKAARGQWSYKHHVSNVCLPIITNMPSEGKSPPIVIFLL